MFCRIFRRDLTALVDRELTPARAGVVRAHIARCNACAQLLQDIEATVAQERQLVPLAFGAVDVASGVLLGGVRARLQQESVARRWVLQPALMGTLVAAGVVIATYLGMLDPVFIAVGLESPPEVVAEQPELFRDYAFFERLDALEHFDDVNSVQLHKSGSDQPQG